MSMLCVCRHRRNGAVIARCSQPEVGWLGWRNDEDEKLLKAIATACAIDSGGGGIGGATSDQTKDNGHTTEQPTILNGEAGKTQAKKALKDVVTIHFAKESSF